MFVADAVRILVVEDDPSIRLALESALSEEGYEVRAEPDGSRLDAVHAGFSPDLAVLDVRLPDGPHGYDLSRQLRRLSDLPVLFLTAADSVEDRLAGFDAGCDDYMVKPFAIAELVARIRALLRRSGRGSGSSVRAVGDLLLDDGAEVVTRDGARIDLTPTEYTILDLLTRSPERIFSKIQLMNQIWGFEGFSPNIVEVHISSLRQKLEEHGPRIIHTVRGRGYRYRH